MRRHCLSALAVTLALALLLTGCPLGETPVPTPSVTPTPSAAPTPTPEKTPFTLSWDPADGAWDPYGGGTSVDLTLLGLIAQGLYELDAAFRPRPVLVETAQVSADGLTWTFTLKTDALWSDGTPFTASAAAACLERARRAPSVYAGRLADVRKLTAPDDATLVITLSAPRAGLPALLDVPLVRLTDDGLPLGTGPYLFSPAEPCLLARTDCPGGADLPLKTIALTPVTDADGLLEAFDAGRLSLTTADLGSGDALGFAGDYRTWSCPTATLLYLGCQGAKGPCADPDFRRALSLALDRESLIYTCLEGWGDAALYPAVPGWAGCPDQTAPAPDPAAARAALDALYPLKEDGLRYDRRTPVTLRLIVNSDNAVKVALARRIARTLEELGLTVTVDALSWNNFRKALERNDFDLYLGQCRLTADMDLTPFLTPGSGLSYGTAPSEELAAAVAAARTYGAGEGLYELWEAESPIITLGFRRLAVLTRWGSVSGLTPTQSNVFYRVQDWTVE